MLNTVNVVIEKWTELPLQNVDIDDYMIRRIKYFDFKSIGDIETALKQNEIPYLKFVQIFLKERIEKRRPLLRVACLMYFLHYLVLTEKYKDKRYGYFNDPEIKYAINFEMDDFLSIYNKSLI